MVHLASFLVGSAVSGTVFLVLHEQLSHRSRLSPKWKFRETAEDYLSQAWQQLRYGKTGEKQQLQSDLPPISTKDITKKWNNGVSYLEDILRRKD